MSNQQLHSVSEWWRIFVDSVTDYAFILLDLDNRVAAWNIGAERLLGFSAQEIIGKSAELFFTPEDRRRGEVEREVETAIRDGRAEDERMHLRKDGSRFWASGSLTALRGEANQLLGFAKVMRDVTQRENARHQTEQALREKMVMLGEVHHRVKNNLQLIMSLMRLQTDRVHDPLLLQFLEKAQNRVRAIALAQERLYSSEDLTSVHMGRYLENLARDLHQFYEMEDQVNLRVTSVDVALGVNEAIPLALVAHELLSNAFEHAFPDGRRGTVRLSLTYGGPNPGDSTLEVEDDGIGMPPGVRLETSDTLGFDIVRLLSSQLAATVMVKPVDPGSCVRVSFPTNKDAS